MKTIYFEIPRLARVEAPGLNEIFASPPITAAVVNKAWDLNKSVGILLFQKLGVIYFPRPPNTLSQDLANIGNLVHTFAKGLFDGMDFLENIYGVPEMPFHGNERSVEEFVQLAQKQPGFFWMPWLNFVKILVDIEFHKGDTPTIRYESQDASGKRGAFTFEDQTGRGAVRLFQNRIEADFGVARGLLGLGVIERLNNQVYPLLRQKYGDAMMPALAPVWDKKIDALVDQWWNERSELEQWNLLAHTLAAQMPGYRAFFDLFPNLKKPEGLLSASGDISSIPWPVLPDWQNLKPLILGI